MTDRQITSEKISKFLKGSNDPSDLFSDQYYVLHTSGTSGDMGYFVFSLAEWTRGAATALRYTPLGLSKRRLAWFGATQGHYAAASLAASTQRSATRWIYDIATFEINAPLAPSLDGLNAFQPTILTGNPTGISVLAEQQLAGKLSIAPNYVQMSGEQVRASDRDLIEQAFGVPLLNIYACAEHLLMGLECPKYGGMYLFEDDFIFEFRRDHTLVTNLYNYTMPMIRYRMNDVMVACEDKSPVLPFKKVELTGRSEHVPRFVNERGEEDFILPMIFNNIFIKNMRRCQLRLIDQSTCELHICCTEGLDPDQQAQVAQEAHQQFSEILAQKQMRNVRYEVKVVDDLPIDPHSGKFQMIVPPASKPVLNTKAFVPPEPGRAII